MFSVYNTLQGLDARTGVKEAGIIWGQRKEYFNAQNRGKGVVNK